MKSWIRKDYVYYFYLYNNLGTLGKTCTQLWWFGMEIKWPIWKVIIHWFFWFQQKIGQKTQEAIKKRYGTKYTLGSISETICELNSTFLLLICIWAFFCIQNIDVTSGCSIDWVHANRNVSLSYVFEFRDSHNGMKNLYMRKRERQQMLSNCFFSHT